MNAANRYHWDSNRFAHRGQSAQAQWRGGIGFRRCGKDRTSSHVVRAFLFCTNRVFHGFRRHADDPIFRHQPPGIGQRHILLPQMDTIGLRRQRHIHPVIDNQRHTRTLQDRPHRTRFLDKFSRAAMFLPQLYARCAASHGLADNIRRRPPSRQTAIRHQIES